METAIPSPTLLSRSYRIDSIDLLRGLVMIIMALDHTRDFFHAAALTDDPLNLQTTTPALFFTRWITHICAPVFVFLSGTSAYLQGLRKPKKELSVFLLKRGLWLILAEICIVSLAITFDITYSFTVLQVIWAIGVSMVILGFTIFLPFNVILVMGAMIVLGHNLLDYMEVAHKSPFPMWYALLHVRSTYPLFKNHMVGILYPFLPWTGVMMLGYCFGSIFGKNRERSNTVTIFTGCTLLVFFAVLRMIDGYGDPLHWEVQKSGLFTFFSFINTQKYPPSLLYLCVTLGPALIFMGLAGKVSNRLSRIITVYGRVPFLYYVVHFYILHLISAVLYLQRGHTLKQGLAGIPNFPFRFMASGEGYSLGLTYLIWLSVVIALYPVCKWFGRYKQIHKSTWLSYL